MSNSILARQRREEIARGMRGCGGEGGREGKPSPGPGHYAAFFRPTLAFCFVDSGSGIGMQYYGVRPYGNNQPVLSFATFAFFAAKHQSRVGSFSVERGNAFYTIYTAKPIIQLPNYRLADCLFADLREA